MTEKYTVTTDTNMMAPKWLADRINYKTVKFLRVIRDGAEVLKGVRIDDQTAKIGDTIRFHRWEITRTVKEWWI